MLSKLLRHVSNYSLGSLLVSLTSLVSFPLFTRIFSVEEYGLMNLVSAALMFVVGAGKLGMQHAIVRMYGESAAGKSKWSLDQFYGTVIWGMAVVGVVVCLLWAGLSQLVPNEWWNDDRVRGLFLLTAVLVFLRISENGLVNLLRADFRSGIYAIYQVIAKYAVLGAILVAVFFVSRSLYGFYGATILVESVGLMFLWGYVLRKHPVSPKTFSPELFQAMVRFGVPMLGFELSRVLLNIGDRYMIQFMLGGQALGHYAAAYNMTEYVQMIAIASVGQAIVPMYVRMWEDKGEAETRRFLLDSMRYYLLIGMPIIAGVSVIGRDLLVLLASEKYREGAVVIPWVMSALVVQGSMVIVGAGLYIHKQTVVIMLRVFATAVLNVLLNLVLIPQYGIVGAAVATLICAIFLAGATVALTRHSLPLGVPWRGIARYGFCSALMYIAVMEVPVGGGVAGIAVKVITGVVSYALLLLVFDRKNSLEMLGAIRARLAA
ncbi:MAG: oligosaccharide flippase family protein [Acidiferrobacteraceae bacterium]|jgi:O-antigen/teichoic acid export membrane protein